MAVTTNGSKPPTNEQGTSTSTVFNWTGVLPWSQFMDDAEKSPELMWPRSIEWYDQMRNDAQCQGLYLGATAALRRYGWYIDPNDCDPFYTQLLAADLNLVIGEDAARQALTSGAKSAKLRSQGRFSWYRHLATLLRALYYGHFYFEQVGDIRPDGPNGEEVWRLRKLGPRHPRTITQIKVADDGGLVSIVQGYGRAGSPPPEIPVDRLVAYVWDQDPGNWIGRSIFRPMYRDWLIKDRLLRVDAVKHERNGVGMPIIEGPPGATAKDLERLDDMAQEYKVGERGGGAVPNGTKLRLVGTEGNIPDTIGSIRFHNEEMAKSMLMMFMQLGQTETGSRALGDSFIDWFAEQQTFIADWVVGVTVEYVIEDWWNWNVDPNAEQTPRLGYVRDEEFSQPTTADFAGATLPSGFDEPPGQSQSNGSLPATARVRPDRHRHVRIGTTNTDVPGGPVSLRSPTTAMTLPNRKLRRQPYAHEIAASVDFNGIEDDHGAARAAAETAWTRERATIMEELRGVIAQAEPGGATEAVLSAAADAVLATRAAAAGEQASAIGEAGATTQAAMADIIHKVAQSATMRARNELVNQGLHAAASYGGKAYGAKGTGSYLYGMARDHMSGIRTTFYGNVERLAAKLAAGAVSGQGLADAVYNEILGRVDAFASDQLKGMINTAINENRIEVFNAAADDAQLYASELLDENTCSACVDIDGQELTPDEASELYAGGGYIDCDGGPRCRGTVVAVYSGEGGY
jgi:hypothetical protein